jgi:hypothetical protein
MFHEAIKLTYEHKQKLEDELKIFEAEMFKQLDTKKKEISNLDQAIKGLKKVQAEYDRSKGNLAVQKGICPFPESCNEASCCTKDRCNADCCSNGYAYRAS